MNETIPDVEDGKASRRPSRVYAGSTRSECERLNGLPHTRSAQALLTDIGSAVAKATWLYWNARGLDKDAQGERELWVGQLFDAIDRHITQALEQCETVITSEQIRLLQVLGHPAGGLARALLEQHRTWMGEWVHLRALDMAEEDHEQWRRFLSCGVEVHCQMAELQAQAPSAPVAVAPLGAPSNLQSVTAALSNLLLAGQIDKAQALHMVDLIADYVAFCKQMPSLPACIQPVWARVRRAVDNTPVALPLSTLQLLFPGRLLYQVSGVNPTPGTSRDRLFNDTAALVLADDYERLAWRLTFPPPLPACLVAPQGVQAQNALGAAYELARATLVASASLLRALFRRQALKYGGDEEFVPNEGELRDMSHADEDLPAVEVDLDALQASCPDPLSEAQLHRDRLSKDRIFADNPEFCGVCFRVVESRKFCEQHVNTGGRSRSEIRAATQLLPAYRKALFNLQAALRDPGLQVNQLMVASMPDVALATPVQEVRSTTLEQVLEQTPIFLQHILERASWGLEATSQTKRTAESGPVARHGLAQAVAEIAHAIELVRETSPAVWAAVTVAIADLQGLNRECDALGQLIDLALGWQATQSVEKERLLGHEWRVFVAAYNADMLGRMATMCGQSQEVAAVPEDLRRHFYIQWFDGYRPQFAYGHALVTQAHDKGYLAAAHDSQSPLSMESLWEHFARLTAWRVAESQPAMQKQRMRRLTRTKVLALRDQGVSVEEIAQRMRTTPKGVLAAISRWEAKLDAKGQLKSGS